MSFLKHTAKIIFPIVTLSFTYSNAFEFSDSKVEIGLLGSQRSYSKYKDYSRDSSRNGFNYGAMLKYYTPNLYSNDFLGALLGLEGDYVTGKESLTGRKDTGKGKPPGKWATRSQKNDKVAKLEGRLVGVLKFNNVDLYTGLGYMHKSNKPSGQEGRKGDYTFRYMLIGAKVTTYISDGFDVGLHTEYDILLPGSNYRINLGTPKANKFEQKGFGIKAGLDFIFNKSFVLGTHFEYWYSTDKKRGITHMYADNLNSVFKLSYIF